VRKKTGKWGMCVDYRHLIARSTAEAYPLPRTNHNNKIKASQQKQAGKMLTRPVEEPFEVLCADFVESLPRSKQGNNMLLVFLFAKHQTEPQDKKMSPTNHLSLTKTMVTSIKNRQFVYFLKYLTRLKINLKNLHTHMLPLE